MNTTQLVNAIHSGLRPRGRPTKRAIAAILKTTASVIAEAVPLELVFFPKLGVFRLVRRKGMQVTAPNGSKHDVHDRWELKFRAAPVLRKFK